MLPDTEEVARARAFVDEVQRLGALNGGPGYTIHPALPRLVACYARAFAHDLEAQGPSALERIEELRVLRPQRGDVVVLYVDSDDLAVARDALDRLMDASRGNAAGAIYVACRNGESVVKQDGAELRRAIGCRCR